LLGIAYFNGDLVEKDWTRAYALMTLASGAGLPQATPAIAEMDRHIPLEQRQQAAGLAVQMRNEADAARSSELAAFDLAAQAPAPTPATTAGPPAPRATTQAVVQAAAETPRVPRPIPTVAVSPSVAAARAAITEASRATGTESPGEAGASFARTAAPQAEVALAPAPAPSPEPPRVAAPAPPATVARTEPAPAASAPAPARVAASGGPWRVQLGAFSVAGNADRLWRQLSGRAELAGAQRLLVPAGNVTKLQAGGFATRSAADSACRSLRQSGQDCLVTDR
jgi:hypothetical protein